MASMDASTGVVIDDLADVAQSIATIVATPIGTRVMRRAFGSHVFDLVDSPGTARGALRLIVAATDAIERWEPRVRVESATVAIGGDGRAIIATRCRLKIDGRPLEVPIPVGALQ